MSSRKSLPVWFERGESAFIAALVVVAFMKLHFAWGWLLVLFLPFDISMVGYLLNPRIGALSYNAVHNYAGPSVLGILYLCNHDLRWAAFFGLAWAFHIAGDRLQGYGLKLSTGFNDTHLGSIGRNKSQLK